MPASIYLVSNLVPRALFPGFGGAPKAREKRPGDEVVLYLIPEFPYKSFIGGFHRHAIKIKNGNLLIQKV